MTQVLMGRPLAPASAIEEAIVGIDCMTVELSRGDLHEVGILRRLVAYSAEHGCPELSEIAAALVAHDRRENRLHRELPELSAVLGGSAQC